MNFNNCVKLIHSSFRNNNSNQNLILLHGLFGCRSNFRSIAKAIAKQKPNVSVFTIDLRNHGESPHTLEHNYHAMAMDVCNFIQENNLQNEKNTTTLLGHSMGGKVALSAALDPELQNLISQLFIVDVTPHSAIASVDSTFQQYIKYMKTLNLDQPSRREIEEEFKSFIPEDAIRSFLMTNLESKGGKFFWRINLDTLSKSIPEIQQPLEIISKNKQSKFERKTMFLGGSKSTYIPNNEKDHNKLLELFPNSKIEYLNTGHWVHSEDPKNFIQKVCDFL